MSLKHTEPVASSCRLAAVMAVLSSVLSTTAVLAAEVSRITSVELTASQTVDVARTLITAGRLDQASTLLLQLERDNAGGEERRFLQGMLALAAHDYGLAEKHFRAVLDGDPTLLRVRLELARVLFLQRQDGAADYHFQLALAGNPPDPVVQAVHRYRQIIRSRRAWRLDLGVGIAPDTNINGATSQGRVSILGLPFELDDAARASSGIGVSLNVDARYRFRRETWMPLYVGVYARTMSYRQHDFDDASLGVEAGPEFDTPYGSLRAAITAGTRWYAHDPYNDSVGIRLVFESPVRTGWAVSGSIETRMLRHRERTYLDGASYDASLSASRVLAPGTIGSLWAGVRRNTAAVDAYSSRTVRIGIGISHEAGRSLHLGLGGEAARTLNDEPLGIFAARRKDWGTFIYGSVTKGDFRIAGLAPTLRLSYATTASTIDFYEATRWRSEIVLLRAF